MLKKIKNILKNYIPCLVLMIIIFLIGCYIHRMSIGIEGIDKIILLFLAYLPVIIFLVIIFFNFFGIQKSILFIICLFGLLPYYFGTYVIYCWSYESAPNINIKYYNYYINSEDLKEIFPKDIPKNAEKIEFKCIPTMVLQDKSDYALYYIDDSLTKEEFDKKYKEKAKWIGYIDDYVAEYNENHGSLSTAFDYTSTINSEDFLIYLIEDGCDDSGYCRHGRFSFAAFNEEKNEVIYRFSKW